MQENINIPDSNITSSLTFRNLVLMNMQQLTNFPYIEKDFDALTDYELLSLVVKYLNDVIDNQNEQNDSITNMYNAFLALQTYVNNTKDTLETAFNNLDDYVRNYFENLDVQEEINNKLDQMVEDGTFAELLQAYTGGYIFVDSIPNIKKYATKADALSATDVTNASIINGLITSGNKGIIFGSGYYPFESYLKLTNDIEVYSIGGNGNLLFPDSDGFNFDATGYFQNIILHDLIIESKSYCINFKNDGTTYPNNVFKSKFYNLTLTSEDNDCIYAGNNLGYGGDILCFNLEFDRIKVKAPNGAGFYGLGNLFTTYNNVSDFESIKYVFRNCWGKWTNCNTSFAHAEWFLYDDNMPTRYSYTFEFDGCNFEDVTRGGLYFNNPSNTGIQNLIIKNCYCQINYDGEEQLTNHPITFKSASLLALTINNLNISFKGGKTWDQIYSMAESTIATSALTQSSINTCFGKMLILSGSNLVNVNNDYYVYTSAIGLTNQAVKYSPEIRSSAFVGGRTNAFYDHNIGTGGANVNLTFSTAIYDGINFTNASSDTNLNYIYLNRVLPNNQNGKLITLKNSSGHNLTLSANSGYSQRFIFEDGGSSKVLANGDVMCCAVILIGTTWYFKELVTATA